MNDTERSRTDGQAYSCVSCGWEGNDPDTREYEKTDGARCPECGFTGVSTDE